MFRWREEGQGTQRGAPRSVSPSSSSAGRRSVGTPTRVSSEAWSVAWACPQTEDARREDSLLMDGYPVGTGDTEAAAKTVVTSG